MGQFDSQIPHFLESFLSQYKTAIPKGAQWVLFFDDLQNIAKTIVNTIGEREPRGWDIKALTETLSKDEIILRTKGCLFAQAVEIPSESIVAQPEGLQMNGFLRATAGLGRNDYSNGLRIGFLETNFSFVDGVIRPWVITTGHLGLIARPPEQQYRCNITVYKLGVTSGPIFQNRNGVLIKEGVAPKILQEYTFHGACPISITGEEYNYSPATGPVIRETTFIYNYYTVKGPERFLQDLVIPPGTPSTLLPAIAPVDSDRIPGPTPNVTFPLVPGGTVPTPPITESTQENSRYKDGKYFKSNVPGSRPNAGIIIKNEDT